MSQVVPLSESNQHELVWREAVVIAAISLLVLVAVFWQTFSSIVAIWLRADTYTHGFLIIPIVVYLIWQRRKALANIEPQPTVRVAGVLFFLSLIWFAGYETDVLGIQFIAVVAMIPILLWMLLGKRVAVLLAFPFAYLFFAVPMGDFLVPLMQDLTATFTVKALQLSGIPVYWEGRFFHIPTGSFEVAEACSGVRYLIASFALGTLYAYLTFQTLSRRLIFVALSIVVPIFANGLRAYGIVMLAHLSDYQLAVGVDHLIYGWVFFGLVIGLLFWLGSLYREAGPIYASLDENSTKADVCVPQSWQSSFRKWVSPFTLAVLVALSGPLAAAWLETVFERQEPRELLLPQGTSGWEGPYAADNPLGASYYGASSQVLGTYRKAGRAIEIYVAHYANQSQGEELINSQNSLYDADVWRRSGEQMSKVILDNGAEYDIHVVVISSGNKTRLLWHWYSVSGLTTSSPFLAKLYELRARLVGNQVASSAVVLATDYDLDPKEAQTALKAFMEAMLPGVKDMVGDRA